ncbi:MAG: HDIG domain-containing protein [Candidatus Parvarchaeota archaeon]|nr:HDIG domain-containing protein [Candidatus Jingweiarchaeum tengchongense]MCW1298369.1 HDIG domain-containing protein [Candidatus Jingweiarchaeum tengchongense]MCW1300329.1 HDIG domain-containing protein [Candidatus Jingweiarchaeum tengchongense]MCW1304874.1 HDIG domain-containing protein [Candidatus Jingweiarchaeum tengchongense]MCW1305825.1 HDIG domain-containing protein [Candidatus Jingweiarchaeum tengchongense]
MLTRKQAIKLLKKAGCRDNVIQHCIAVSKLATEIAKKAKENRFPVDIKLVEIGALLHDIGRSSTHTIKHWNIGSEILKDFSLPANLTRFAEVHAGTKISAEDAKRLGIKEKDYYPKTIEEKIVAYADKLTKVRFSRKNQKWKFIFYEDISHEISKLKKKKDLSDEQKNRIINDLIMLENEVLSLIKFKKLPYTSLN